jgi:hypothetical protein
MQKEGVSWNEWLTNVTKPLPAVVRIQLTIISCFVRYAVMAIIVKIKVTWVMTLKFNAYPSTFVLSH